MYISLDAYSEAFQKVKEDSLLNNKPVLILVAPDVDALCACKILVTLLKADCILHKVIPVSGYSDFSAVNQNLLEGKESVKSVFLLNCGGVVDLSEFFNLDVDVVLYVLDSHRPYNLYNCFVYENIFIFDDGEIQEDLQEVRHAFEELEYNEESDTESGTSDVEQEDRPNQRRKTGVDTEITTQQLRRQKIQFRKLISEYYRHGTFFGSSTTGIMYALSDQLSRASNDFLWYPKRDRNRDWLFNQLIRLAIIGLTEQYLLEHIDKKRYQSQVEVYRSEVQRFSYIDDDLSENHLIKKADHSITCEEEFRFMLLRHWSLLDSMLHSNYVATKLGVWKEKGRKQLRNILARMGFSLQQCEQVYTHMNYDLKKNLKAKLLSVGPDYGLHELCYMSFAKSYGYACVVSASDAVYSIYSLLHSSAEVAVKLGVNIDWVEAAGQLDEDQENLSEEKWFSQFYTAFDALSRIDLLQRGLDLSMQLQKAIVRQGTTIMEKMMVKTLKKFRLVVLKDGPDLPLFVHPLSLSQLALFLVEALREYRKSYLPFVIAALRETSDSYLVVGINGAFHQGDIRKNTFGLGFQLAANRTGARCKNDYFEASVIEVRKEDLGSFMERLQVMDL